MGVTFLLDTHILLWLLYAPEKMPAEHLEHLAQRENTLVASAVSAMEVSTKVRLGKLMPVPLVHSWDASMRSLDAQSLAISPEHAVKAGSFEWEHRDPFDRLLVAQALVEGMTLVTVDRAILGLTLVPTLAW